MPKPLRQIFARRLPISPTPTMPTAMDAISWAFAPSARVSSQGWVFIFVVISKAFLPKVSIASTHDVSDALWQCHVYVEAGDTAALPAGALAALAAGRPVIAANTPGCRDVVDDFVNGCLVEPGSAAAIVKAMEIFTGSPELIETTARASRLKAERRFDRREINQQWLKVLALTA